MKRNLVFIALGSLIAAPSFANTLSNPEIGVVLDGYYQNNQRNQSERKEGFGLGHTEINMSANIDDKFHGVLTAVLESHDDTTETILEEAFVETLALPYGLNVRAGRFLSDFGYLNNQHTHSDSFVERPIAYRTFLGSHYFDNGVRANIVLPTDLYIKLGVEALGGKKMSSLEEGEETSVGVYTTTLKVGGDLSESSSWQFGLSYLRNQNGKVKHFEDHDHEEDHGHSHGDGHNHSHGAAIKGENLYGADLVWKWAPDGNYKYSNFTLSAEYMLLDGAVDSKFKDDAESPDNLSAYYVSGVYRFNPSWSTGLRYGESESYDGHAHGDHMHFTALEDKELDAMVAWDSSHFGTVRAQYSRVEYSRLGMQSDKTDNVITLQYVMTFGAHGAHAY